jgi:hypothetical protein
VFVDPPTRARLRDALWLAAFAAANFVAAGLHDVVAAPAAGDAVQSGREAAPVFAAGPARPRDHRG